MRDIAKENLITLGQETNNIVNKKIKLKNNLKKNDIVFVLDRHNLPGKFQTSYNKLLCVTLCIVTFILYYNAHSANS